MVTDAAEHGWLCGPLIRGRSPVRFRVLRLRAGKCPAGAHNPSLPGAVPGPATIVRTVAPPRRRAARSGSGALAHQEEHLTCNEEAVGSSPTSSTIQPRWWSWPTRLPLKEEITGSNPVRGTATLAGTTRPRPAARPPTWWNADTPDPKPGAAGRGGASPPVGTTPPAPAGPRPLYRRVRGSTPRGGSGRATAASGSDGTQTCQPQKLVPSGACECKSRLPHQGGSVTVSRAPPAPARTRRSYRRWRGSAPRGGSGRPWTVNAEVVER